MGGFDEGYEDESQEEKARPAHVATILRLRRPLERAADRPHAAVGGAEYDMEVVCAVVAGQLRESGLVAGFSAAPERGQDGGDVRAEGGKRARRPSRRHDQRSEERRVGKECRSRWS